MCVCVCVCVCIIICIGPESTKMIQQELSDCKTIIWNGIFLYRYVYLFNKHNILKQKEK
jgi:hypothetical protein